MTRWIVLAATMSLVACGGDVEPTDDDAAAVAADDAGADTAPDAGYSICGPGKVLRGVVHGALGPPGIVCDDAH